MCRGVPVATFATGEAGTANAVLFAVAMLANNDPVVAEKLKKFREAQRQSAMAMKPPPE
ncbi:MAG: AIR carboxylase family protein [Thiothrix sp.]|uniref:AIR carboxylase family protein n=1 Tax=Thiothrix sp. TaxID=1032 RepID=UPI00261C9FD3|nr:AIR carboxylase family protein [Thiothrix sp.]MDD5394876.1 AIR carboxylase family protein [Thiothrix sp.]